MTTWTDPEPLLEVASGLRASREPSRGYWIRAPRTREEYDADRLSLNKETS